ncbi:MAG TPA: tetratricopeptide repeat protein [Thermoanaerobaculia bacterium]|nr:tetratricopeptide repeat protein [Thermoanaerobaculia bacterium]
MRRALALALLLLAAPLAAQVSDVPAAEAPPQITPDEQKRQDDFVSAASHGMKFFERGDMASAYEQFVAADAIYPNHPTVVYDMAVLLVRLGRLAEAQEKVDLYLSLHPDGPEIEQIKTLRSDIEFERKWQRQLQETQSYLELFNRAKFHYGRGEWAEALAHFQRAAEQKPGDPAAFYNQALALEKLGDYARAIEGLRRYQALASHPNEKARIDAKLFELEREIQEMRTMIVCPFCGHKLPEDAPWCPHCWKGPYLSAGTGWTARSCAKGASAIRTTAYGGGRLAQNEELPCLIAGASLREDLRYSRARQKAIRQAREAEGWKYEGENLVSPRDQEGRELRLVHGQYLEKLVSPASGDLLTFAARPGANGRWLLEQEEFILDGQKFRKRYEYDAEERIVRELVDYDSPACGHHIETEAAYVWEGGRVARADLRGGYTGFDVEGTPVVAWTGTVTSTVDASGRIDTERFVLGPYTKTFAKRPEAPFREIAEQVYSGVRAKKPIDLAKSGDFCALSGGRRIGNQIDLRPFYTFFPNVAIVLPWGVTDVKTTFTYPQ